MRGKMKWLVFSLLVLVGLALSLTLFSGGQGAGATPAAQKMPKGLQTLCALYNDLGVQKLGPVSREQLVQVKKTASPEQQARILMLQKLLGSSDDSMEKQVFRQGGMRGLDAVIPSDLQARWSNPPFEVGRGMITASSDPRSLQSSYLKVRKSWKQGDNWKAFCEFAISKAEQIASDPSIRYLSLLPAPQLDNDLGSASTSAPRLRVGEPGNWDGDVDSGVDWAHGDFLNPDGTSRILYLWDTSVDTPGKDPETLFGMTGFDYGTVWTQAEINGGSCTEFDPSSSGGHGTHTCGTAAGNGGATGNYTGMAPNADIIFVKGLDPYGVEFIFEMARRLGRPAVVNNSWGISWATYGPYIGYVYLFPGDGSDEYSQYFNWLMSEYPRGSVIVKSAGNNGMFQTYHDNSGQYGYALYQGSLHFGNRTVYGKPVSHVYHRINHSFGYGVRREYSDMMIRSNVPVQVKVRFTGAGHGQTFIMKTGDYGEIPGASTYGYDTTWVDLDMGQDPYNGEYMGVIWFDAEPSWGATTFFPEGDWIIEVTPLTPGKAATYDVWAYSRRSWYYNSAHTSVYSFYDSCFRGYAGHEEYQLDWAASPDVLTTGAWTTRNEWLGADGLMHYPWSPYNLEPKINTITYFSSPGPSRDGRMKPDIAAPGAIIISTMPANLAGGITNANKDPDMRHQWMWGTSMAAPHSTGAVALYLQKFPGHTFANVRYYLSSWAKKDIFTTAIGTKGFGAGKLNVSNLKTPPVAKITVDNGVLDLSNHQFATFSGAGSYDPDKLPFKLKWTLLAKPAGSACQFTPGGSLTKLVPDKVGTYKVGLVAEGVIYNSPAVMLTVQAVE
jgi:subtilisin family serine protease